MVPYADDDERRLSMSGRALSAGDVKGSKLAWTGAALFTLTWESWGVTAGETNGVNTASGRTCWVGGWCCCGVSPPARWVW